jgi:fibronectin-binding autotransporter adhesin
MFVNVKNQIRMLAVGLFAAAGMFAACADTLTWDPGATGGSGGNGTWNLNSTINWWNGSADIKWLDNSATGTNVASFGGTAGTVTLGSSLSASNLQFTTSGYTLSGANTLTLGGGGIDASSLGSGTTTIGNALSLSGGQQSWLVGGGSTLAINGAINRAAGATVDVPPSGVTSSTLANVNDILGGWATVGGVNSVGGDWAANDGAGHIITYAGYTQVTGNQTGAGASAQNWENSGGIATLTASASINSLNQLNDFNVNAGCTLTLNSGGLILGNVSRWMLAGSSETSFLKSGLSTGELFVHVPDADSGDNWTIWPLIADNGGTPLQFIKDGAGEVKLGNMNTYSGGTIVNNGMLAYTGNAEYGQGSSATGTVTPFGTGSITVNNGSQLQLGCNVGANNFSAFVITNPITLNNAILYENDGFFHVTAPLTIGAGGATLGATYDNKGDTLIAGFAKGLFVDGFLTGTGNMTVQDSGLETVNAWDSSAVYFTSAGTAAQNTYSGTITVNPFTAQGGSYLFLVGANALANATINLTGDNDAGRGRFGSPTLLFGSGTNLDGVGYATIGGLAGSGSFVLANTLVSQSGSSIGAPFALTVGNNNSSSTYSGVMSGAGSLTKVGSGTLTLSGINTYTGDTFVNGGALILTAAFVNSTNFGIGTGAMLDVSSLGPVTIPGNLASAGTLNGSVSFSSSSKVYAGTDGGYGTNTFAGSVTLASGTLVYLDLGTAANGTNDLISVTGGLTANNIIHLKAPSTSANLDTTADYVLIKSPAGITGGFAAGPVWDVAPANAAHFTIVTSPTTVTLHYSAATSGPTAGGSVTPATLLRNQSVTVTVNATNGSPGTVSSVTVDASPIGGSSTLALAKAGSSGNDSVWTNTVIVGPGSLAGGKTLVVTVTDSSTLTAVFGLPLTVVVANDVWNGAGANDNFSTESNWTNHLAPGFVGDSLEFAGATKLTPNMDNSYTVAGLSFDSGAGSFTIGTANSSTLTLAGGLINNSANTETLSVPITLSAAQTINAAAGDVALGGVISGAGSLTKTGPATLTLSATGNSLSGNLSVLGGTLNISSGSSAFGTGLSYVGYRASSGTLTLSGGSLTTGAGGDLWVGGSDVNGTAQNAVGTLTVSGGATVTLGGRLVAARGNNNQNTVSGTVTINSGSALSCENDVLLGFAGNNNLGKVIVNGGTFNVATTTKRWVIMSQWDTAQSEIDVNSGQMNINANTDIRFAINGNAGTNTFNLNGGAVTFYGDNATTVGGSGVVDLHQGNGSPVYNTFNLNGGTLTVSGVTVANTLGTQVFNFNGGRLKGTGDNASFVSLGSGSAVANVRDAGAMIDDGGFSLGIPQALLHSAIAGDNATDGGLTKLGVGTLTLSGVNTYNGPTLVNAGTLALSGAGSIGSSPSITVGSGATFDVAGAAFTLAANQALSGFGTNNGAMSAAAGATIYGGTDGTYGTNTFNNDLTLASGAACYLDLGTVFNGNNDRIVVNGTVTANGNAIHIKAPNTASLFDITADYVLISSANAISGTFASVPVWEVAPANAGHFSIVTSGNTVLLRYSAIAAPVVAASANPTTVLRNQPTVITANVLPGSSAINTVTVDLTPLGGALLSLVQSNASTLYTNAVTIPATASAGGVTLTVTATDTSARSGSASVPLTIRVSMEVWNGLGNQSWSANADWASGYAPGLAGDTIIFAGSVGTSPNLDANYSITGLTYSNNASSFTIGTANSSALTLTANGILNNSTSAQIINVPVALSAAETINAASGNITLNSTLNSDVNLLTVAGAGNTTMSGVVTGVGLTKNGSGTLTFGASGNSLNGSFSVNGGALNVTGGSTAFGTGVSRVGYLTGSGNLTMTGGSLTTDGELQVGGSDQNGTSINATGAVALTSATLSVGALTVARGNNNQNTCSGTVTLNPGSVLNSESDVLLGFAGNNNLGKVVVNGGTLNVATATKRWLIMSEWDTSLSEFDVNSGQVNLNANTDIRFATGGNNGTNTFNLNGGAVTFYSDNATTVGGSGVVDLHQGSGSAVVNTFNLNGGTLTVSGVTAANSAGTKTFNFNGGTLKATVANSSLVNIGTASAFANVRNGGAIIDDGGFSVGIPQVLQHSAIAGDNATDGGLTKLGAGTLTLSGANTYNGITTVKAGTLELVLATLATDSTVSISNGAVLQLDFATTNRVGALVLNGVAQSPGIYNSSTTPTYITGPGSLMVPSPIASNPTNITYRVSGSTLTLSWPADHLGWLVQSNSVGIAASNAWYNIAGSGSVTTLNVNIDKTEPNVFYRLLKP